MAESILSSTADALLRRAQYFWREPHEHSPPGALSQLVEAEVIPRLHRPPPSIAPPPIDVPLPEPDAAGQAETHASSAEAAQETPFSRVRIQDDEVKTLAADLLKQETESVWRLIRQKYASGMHSEQIAIELLGAAARHLGAEYARDRCSFAEVTVCSGYLHQMLRDLYSRLDHASEVPGFHHRILLLPAPGEQHILGLSILGESFRRRGWDVSGGPAQDRTELLKLIAREHFDAIGFSIGSERWLSPLADELHRLKRNAQNRNILVMVGGQVVDDQPTLAGALGADLTVRDARLAPDSALMALEDAARV